jgi:hypothetical protein
MGVTRSLDARGYPDRRRLRVDARRGTAHRLHPVTEGGLRSEAMARGIVTEEMPASSAVVFDTIHDYGRRLEWDTLLQAAYVDDGSPAAAKGVVTVCVGRPVLGGLALRTVYVSFDPPRVAAVKMLNRPPFFDTWAASIRHEELATDRSRVTYTFNFTARPRILGWLLEPIMLVVFRWETRKRLAALRAYLAARVSTADAPEPDEAPPSGSKSATASSAPRASG